MKCLGFLSAGEPDTTGLYWRQFHEEMRKALNNCNTDIAKEQPDYVVRVVSDEGAIGRGYLDRFMDVETIVPTLVTTSLRRSRNPVAS